MHAQPRSSERPVAVGGRTTAPVLKVVERTTTRTVTVTVPAPPRPAVRMSGQPYTLPEDAVEWVETLGPGGRPIPPAADRVEGGTTGASGGLLAWPAARNLLGSARRAAAELRRGYEGPARRAETGPERRGAVEKPLPGRAVKQPAAGSFPGTDDLLARLSPLQFDHINFLGRYAFPPAGGRPQAATRTLDRRGGRRRVIGAPIAQRKGCADADSRPCEGRARMATAFLGDLGGPRNARPDASYGMNFTSGKAVLGPSSRWPRRCRRCRSKNASG